MNEKTESTENTGIMKVAEAFDDGLGEVTQEDLIIPRLKIGQKQSKAEGVEGKLYVDITGNAIDEMSLVILKMHKNRVLFGEYDENNKPLCKSDNFITPNIMDGVTPMSKTCKDCAYAKWTKNTAGKSKPPKCNELWNFLVLDFDTYMPAWFSLKSKALKPARKIVSMLKLRGTIKQIPAWGFKFTTTITEVLSAKGNSYIPIFSNLVELEKDDFESMTLIHNQLINEQVNFEEEAKPEGASKAEEETDF